MEIGSQGKNSRQFDDPKMIEIVPFPNPPSSPKLLHKWFAYHGFLSLWKFRENSYLQILIAQKIIAFSARQDHSGGKQLLADSSIYSNDLTVWQTRMKRVWLSSLQ
jgi:hypothetical protein